MSDQSYIGGELELFAQAVNWKRYWVSWLRPFLGNDVLEVGAGIGTNTPFLRSGKERRWVCLEPDPQLLETLKERLAQHSACAGTQTRVGTLASLARDDLFDTILYIDVLEHIEDDRAEVAAALRQLRPGGRLIVLSPAHQWLYSPFDQAIGHYRRYSAEQLVALTPAQAAVEKVCYLDCVGLLASAANRLLLRQSLPNLQQIHCWDRLMVPCSRLLDPLLLRKLGKTVVCVWRRPVA